MRVGLDDAGDRAGVGEDPRDLLGAGRLVDRHGDRAGRPDRVVDQRPLVPGPAHQRRPGRPARCRRRSGRGRGDHLVAELGAGDVDPAAAVVAPRGTAPRPGRRRALSQTGSVRLAASPTVTTGGTENSRTCPPSCSRATDRRGVRICETYRFGGTAGVRRVERDRPGEPSRGVAGREAGSLAHMADSSTQSIVIDAAPEQVAAVICDFAELPGVGAGDEAVEVLEEYEDGYASQVRFALDAGVVADEYTLQYEYAEDISRIEWHLVAPSKMQKRADGLVRHRRQRRRHLDGDLHARGRPGGRHARHVPAQGREDDHGYRAEAAQAPGREPRRGGVSARVPEGSTMGHPDPGSAREEAERLVAAALAMAGRFASNTDPHSGHDGPRWRPARPSAASARSAGRSPRCATRTRTSPSGSPPAPATSPRGWPACSARSARRPGSGRGRPRSRARRRASETAPPAPEHHGAGARGPGARGPGASVRGRPGARRARTAARTDATRARHERRPGGYLARGHPYR